MTGRLSNFSKLLSLTIILLIVSTINQAFAQTDPCAKDYFLKTFTDADSSIAVKDLVVTTANDIILVGSVNNQTTSTQDAIICRIDQSGNKIWERSLSGSQMIYCNYIIQLADKNYLVTGNDLESKATFLLKIDINGNFIWRKNITNAEGTGISAGSSIREDANGNLYQASFAVVGTAHGLLFTKFDNLGNVLYANFHAIANPINPFAVSDLVIKDGYSYVTGYNMDQTNSPYIFNGFLCKTDNSTGALIWSNLYDFNGDAQIFQRIFNYGDNQLCIAGQNSINGSDLNTITICDTAGVVKKVNYFQYGSVRQDGNFDLDSSGNLIYSNWNTNNGTFDLSLCKIKVDSGIVWARHYPILNGFPRTMSIHYDNNNDIYLTGNNSQVKNYMYVGKFSPSGLGICEPQTIPALFGTGLSDPLKIYLPDVSRLFNSAPGNPPAADSRILNGQVLCILKSSCTFVKLSGKDSICSIADTVKLKVNKDPSCLITPKFYFDPSYFKFESFADDTVKFSILQPGSSAITASLESACDTLRDTIQIVIFDNSDRPNLGPDLVLCKGNSIVLHPGSNFKDYQWQDGSTDSTFTVTQKGTYFVQVTQFCGTSYSDTIIVSEAPKISIDLGPDLIKCNADTISIKAPDGFTAYSWAPDYNIKNVSGQFADVFPAKDTVYMVSAQLSPGCLASDTIRITVKKSPPILLGNDTSLCLNTSIVLDAGAGFSEYLWNTGSRSGKLTVSDPGKYTVIGTTADGCRSYDTLSIQSVWPGPLLDLGANTGICTSGTRLLSPGNFSSYLWQDGSTATFFVAADTGLYYVTVTDTHKCKATDSIHITDFLPQPRNFLPQDTSICKFGKLAILPDGNFRQFTWSTGSTDPVLKINQPGTYWLNVTDDNNCTGADTIIVIGKECRQGVYVPSAFTPNNDGINDSFKPVVIGNLSFFEFTVYSRWGEIVFRTNEPGKGWDGRRKGYLQDNNTFVWTCTYQFAGEALVHEKGTALLLK